MRTLRLVWLNSLPRVLNQVSQGARAWTFIIPRVSLLTITASLRTMHIKWKQVFNLWILFSPSCKAKWIFSRPFFSCCSVCFSCWRSKRNTLDMVTPYMCCTRDLKMHLETHWLFSPSHQHLHTCLQIFKPFHQD